ncbi:MAG: hypothetical protein GY760_27770 [Deltaproteobacteria bacterium]|nr:hypothetical protein [Deltaproteobacteria bacterium]
MEKEFSKFGIDSIISVELVNKLNDIFNILLRPTIIFDYTSIRELSSYIFDKFNHEVNKKFCKNDIHINDYNDNEFHSGEKEESLKNQRNESGELSINLVENQNEKTNIKNSQFTIKGSKEQELIQDIAIVGMSGKFPGAENIDQFWNNLSQGKSSITEVPRERWNIEAFYDSDPKNLLKTYCRLGGFIQNIDRFDSLFFNITGMEAEASDPQQRLFLEESWKALEDAGYTKEKMFNSKCGVFVGGGNGDYLSIIDQDGKGRVPQSLWGNTGSMISARVSYFLNLKGPSIVIDTTCSSSLVAVHMACQNIKNSEIDMALAGGVFINNTPNFHIMTSNAQMLSPSGRCNAFDNNADGFIPGEGVGVIVLKRLKPALKDNNNIYGIIKGSSINHDGKTNGITAPSSLAQAEVELDVYRKFNINPESITYVEAHGTGTKLGDPIEVDALTKAFTEFTDKKQFCAIGSVKTNIGHAVAAAGIVSIIKILLSLKFKKLPPSLNYESPNQHINFKDSPFFVNDKLTNWKAEKSESLRAAVSSFGVSGTNAHIVIEEAPKQRQRESIVDQPYYLIPLSAKTENSLSRKIMDLYHFIKREGKNVLLSDIAYTLQAGRSHFPIRIVLIVKDCNELEVKLGEVNNNDSIQNYFKSYSELTKDESQPASIELSQQLIEELKSNYYKHEKYKNILSALADLYLKNCNLDWPKLNQAKSYQLISLPTYPFEKERYWASGLGRKANSVSIINMESEKKHPLVHRNLSTFDEQKYSITLTGNEFFLTDHIYDNQKILPAAVYIEMVAAAATFADKAKIQIIKNIVWIKPIIVSGKDHKEVQICFSKKDGVVEFQVITKQQNENIIHTQGIIIYENDLTNQEKPIKIDLNIIKSRCNKLMKSEECYEAFDKMKFNYRVCFQTIKELYFNKTEALSLIKLPEELSADFNKYILHPSLIDGAFQTLLGLTNIKKTVTRGGFLPFSLNEIKILNPLSETLYVYLTHSDNNPADESKFQKYDITIMDKDGSILVIIKEFSVKKLQENINNKLFDEVPGYMEQPEDMKILNTFTKVVQNELTIDKATQIISTI